MKELRHIAQTREQVLAWAIEKAERDYPGQICLMIQSLNLRFPEERAVPSIDFFVPADGFADTLSRTFIIDGVGVDVYARSWARLEEMAELNDYNAHLMGEGTVVYARSEEDRQRFLALQARFRAHLADPDFMYQKALERLDTAMRLYQQGLFEENLGRVRMYAGYVADYLAQAIACANGDYFRYSQVSQLEELARMRTPEGFCAAYEAIYRADSAAALRTLAEWMVRQTRAFLEENRPPRPETTPDWNGLAGWYQELSYTWLRIRYYCAQNDFRRVFAWGIFLQQELDIVAEEFGFPPIDLLPRYDPDDLPAFAAWSDETERQIRAILTEHGAKIAEYADFAEFARENP